MSASFKDLPEIINSLEQHPETLRLKKLVFCLAKKTWVNDLDTLNSFTWKLLLQEIVLSQPTFAQVIFNIYQIVKSINRKEVYVDLAKYILDKLRLFYPQESEPADSEENPWIIKGIDVRKLNLDDLLEKEEQEGENDADHGAYINIMELAVNEEIFNELKKIPLSIAKYMKPAEIAAYALNRLPPLYASSEQGRKFQNQKIEQFKEVVHAAVMQGIGAVMRDPLRKSTPLNISVNHVHTEAYNVLIRLQQMVEKQNLGSDNSTVNDLADKVLKTVETYELAFTELSNFLRWYGLSGETVTAENLVATIRKILRKQARSNINQLPNEGQAKAPINAKDKIKSMAKIESNIKKKQEAMQTQIIDLSNIPDFPDSTDTSEEPEDQSDDMQTIFSTTVRDWYTF